MTYSRRDLGKLALAALPVSAALGKAINSKVAGVQLGVQSYSFRDLPLDEAIKAMVADGLGDCELFSPHIEMGGMKPPAPGGRNHMTREERRAASAAHEEKLHKWRLTVPL